ncbi:hypothetical protein EYC98_07470 [Halieaceae bacterium IMCC14734]|uniref:Uncharacterized protein n=1 Tax=Candidatus Litorirhabdus singularis TaxID=2518993 RepID=A0ABT3TG13_9GAMM|nr:hypothetical protein [Candidatus Litorirhabdus singularis]MCX2980716.1 hypothetical protein [Candidatus Litorirhabdus singularis]
MALPEFPGGLRAPSDFSTQEPPQLDDYADLEDLLGAAERDAILDVAAEDKSKALQGRANLVREAVIAERLWLLGYLEDSGDLASSPQREERERFLHSITLFQSGAGIGVDQWSGEQTWQALQELVTFENPTNVAKYFDDDTPRPALVRATRLRLWSLGFLNRKPTSKLKSEEFPTEAMEKFWRICLRFKLEAPDRPQPALFDSIHKLFDQDQLLEAVAAAGKRQQVGGRQRWVFSYLKLSKERRRITDPEVQSFLVCLAKIELWLLGFNIDINPRRNFPVYLFAGSTTRRNRKVSAALSQFWAQFGPAKVTSGSDISKTQRRQQERDKARLEECITPELFKALAEPSLAATKAGASSNQTTSPENELQSKELSREVSERLQTHQQIDSAWTKGKSLGMKLWDGARRLWKWLRRGLLKILEIGHNIVRAFFRYSMKAFEIARLALKTVTESVNQYATGQIKTQTEVQILLARDGDMRVTFPAETHAQDLIAATTRLRHFGVAFHLSCRILTAILRAFRAAVIGATGWARMLWMLVRSYRDIRPLYKELTAMP